MDPRDVLFVAGDVNWRASVKIRCQEIALRLGCDCLFDAKDVDDVPRNYKAYICVKPTFASLGAVELGRRALVVWDILDDDPPRENIFAYIASTETAAKNFIHIGHIEVIPHHHCNTDRIISKASTEQVAYFGSEHWYPALPEVPHQAYFVDNKTKAQVASIYRKIGLSLNLRRMSDDFDRFIRNKDDIRPVVDRHILINSGIKLINCLGFGIPSVSSQEPAYLEIAPECTIFTDIEHCAEDVRTLQEDRDAATLLRQRCLALAEDYHIDNIVSRYRSFIRSL